VWSAAFLACLLDSLLGATLQLQFRCAVCGRLTERPLHCEIVAEYASGRPWLSNDSVNIIASTTASVAAVLLYRLFTGSFS
jgi:uncharacterized membrane protein